MNIEQAMELHKAGQLEEARSIYQSLLLTTDDPQILYYLGVVELQMGRLDQAIDALQQVVFKVPNAAASHFALGRALLQSGRLGLAEEHFFQASELEPRAEYFFLLGTVQLQLGDKESAQRCWEMGQQCDPTHVETLLFLGSLYDEAQKEEEAYALWSKAHEQDPTHSEVQRVLGHWYARKASQVSEANPAAALDWIERAKNLSVSADLHHRHAKVLMSLERYAEAEDACLAALAMEQNETYERTLLHIQKLRREQ